MAKQRLTRFIEERHTRHQYGSPSLAPQNSLTPCCGDRSLLGSLSDEEAASVGIGHRRKEAASCLPSTTGRAARCE